MRVIHPKRWYQANQIDALSNRVDAVGMKTLGDWYRERAAQRRAMNARMAAAHGPSTLDVLDGVAPEWDDIDDFDRARMLDRLAEVTIAAEYDRRLR